MKTCSSYYRFRANRPWLSLRVHYAPRPAPPGPSPGRHLSLLRVALADGSGVPLLLAIKSTCRRALGERLRDGSADSVGVRVGDCGVLVGVPAAEREVLGVPLGVLPWLGVVEPVGAGVPVGVGEGVGRRGTITTRPLPPGCVDAPPEPTPLT